MRTVLHDWINGYQNARYAKRRAPVSAAGRWLLPLLPSLRAAADAVAIARARRLDLRQGDIEVYDGRAGCFDVVTMSHVIEHVFDLQHVAQRVYALLKPGSIFWLDTPNIESLGARHLGTDWRGLETPRHLVLFTPSSLRKLLRAGGFRSVRQYWRGMTVFNVYAESEAMRAQDTAREATSDGKPPMQHIRAELREMLQPARREFLTFSARK